MAGSTALKNRSGFGGRSHWIFSLAFVSSDISYPRGPEPFSANSRGVSKHSSIHGRVTGNPDRKLQVECWGKMVRKEIDELRRMGPLPSEKAAIENPSPLIEKYQHLLLSIEKPVTDEEASILVGVFGVDDCFGLAWTLAHLIETAPNWPAGDHFSNGGGNQWVKRLRDREKRSADEAD